MRKKFLGIVCIIYSLIFFYVWIFDKLKNFLSISMQNYLKVASIFILIFGILGFAIGTFKIPENANLNFCRKVGGESIDTVFIRWVKFKRKHNKILFLFLHHQL